MFESLIKQDIAFFDGTMTGEASSSIGVGAIWNSIPLTVPILYTSEPRSISIEAFPNGGYAYGVYNL